MRKKNKKNNNINQTSFYFEDYLETNKKNKILKKTNTLIFLFCELKCNDKIITSASGVWKILKIKPSNLGPGG